jgi:hypothetical protein
MSQSGLEQFGAYRRDTVKAIALIFLLAVSGCRSVPWPSAPAVSTAGWNAEEVRARFEAQLALRIEAMQSVVFHFGRMEMAGIGLVSLDRPNRSFRLACLTPLGVKLFDIAGDGKQTECRFALGGLGPGNEVARAVADDVRRVYFDLTPSPQATVTRRKHALVFTAPQGGGTAEHVFAGAEQRLTEKRFREGGRVAWEILYGPYSEEQTGLTPASVQLRNLRHGYTLTVRPAPDARDNP